MSKIEQRLQVILDNTLGIILGLFGASLILAFFVMWTWNYVMPYLFGFRVIDYWHAFVLHYLCGLLVKTVHINKD